VLDRDVMEPGEVLQFTTAVTMDVSDTTVTASWAEQQGAAHGWTRKRPLPAKRPQPSRYGWCHPPYQLEDLLAGDDRLAAPGTSLPRLLSSDMCTRRSASHTDPLSGRAEPELVRLPWRVAARHRAAPRSATSALARLPRCRRTVRGGRPSVHSPRRDGRVRPCERWRPLARQSGRRRVLLGPPLRGRRRAPRTRLRGLGPRSPHRVPRHAPSPGPPEALRRSGAAPQTSAARAERSCWPTGPAADGPARSRPSSPATACRRCIKPRAPAPPSDRQLRHSAGVRFHGCLRWRRGRQAC